MIVTQDANHLRIPSRSQISSSSHTRCHLADTQAAAPISLQFTRKVCRLPLLGSDPVRLVSLADTIMIIISDCSALTQTHFIDY